MGIEGKNNIAISCPSGSNIAGIVDIFKESFEGIIMDSLQISLGKDNVFIATMEDASITACTIEELINNLK